MWRASAGRKPRPHSTNHVGGNTKFVRQRSRRPGARHVSSRHARQERALAMVGVGHLGAACAAPSRRLTPRQVEDPITLPRGMASASTFGGACPLLADRRQRSLRHPLVPVRNHRSPAARLLSFSYAFLDDAPTGATPSAPLSLGLTGGVLGLGYSSIDGTFLYPVVRLWAAKHVAKRWRFDAGTSWAANWSSPLFRVARLPRRDADLPGPSRVAGRASLSARHASSLTASRWAPVPESARRRPV